MIRKVLTAAIAVSLSAAPALAAERNAVRASTPVGQTQQFVGGDGISPILVFFTIIGAVIVAATMSNEPASP